MENAACHIVYYTGPRKGDAENFLTARITVGKAANNDLRLDGSIDQVAVHHAEILLEDGNVYCLYDLGSKAGTYVNGERVHERCVLMNEDYIRFSQDGPEIIFRTGESASGKQKLPLVFPVTAELEFFSGSDAGRIFPINAAIVNNIGRRSELEIPLDPRGDMIISGNHSNIRYVEGHFVLTDSSRNGTYVNGDLVDQPMEIIDGDVIMLGDGGPQARFRVDLAKRHYPNHRPLSPVVKPAKAQPAIQAMPPAAPKTPKLAIPPGSDKPLSSAAPFATGIKQPDPPAPLADANNVDPDKTPVDTASIEPALVTESSEASIPTMDLDNADFDDHETESGPSATVPVLPSPTATTAAAAASSGMANALGRTRDTMAGIGKRIPADLSRNFAHKIKFRPGKKVIFGAVALVAVIGMIMVFSDSESSESGSEVQPGNYVEALKEVKSVESPNGFDVKLPESWTAIEKDGKVSTESSDKAINLDYLRDARLDESKLRQMLAKNGATVDPKAEDSQDGDVKIKTMRASSGSVRRIAVMHQPASGPIAAALLETTEDTLHKLDDKTLNRLLVSNLTLDKIASPAPMPPPVQVVAATEAPTPPVVAPPPADPVATTATAPPTPAVSATEAEAAVQPDSDLTTKTAVSKALNLKVVVPEDWKTTSEETDGMLTLADNDGLEIRIARDEGDLDPDATFKAMVKEDWNQDGVKSDDPRFRAAQFSKAGQYLLLVLIPEKAKTTLVIYATSKKDFTDVQRTAISNVVLQIVP